MSIELDFGLYAHRVGFWTLQQKSLFGGEVVLLQPKSSHTPSTSYNDCVHQVHPMMQKNAQHVQQYHPW